MRIGIDGRPLQAELAGTGRYVLELCRVLDESFPTAEFFVYSNAPVVLPVASKRWHVVGDSSSFFGRLPSAIWYLERVSKLAKRDSIDVFWGGANFLPRGLDHCKSVLTVLDLVPQLHPETMGLRHRIAYKLYFQQSLQRANRLVTISQGSKNRLEEIFGCVVDEAVFPAVAEHFCAPTLQEMERVRDVHGLHDPYLLAVATLEPRKNLDGLLNALIELKRSGRVEIPDLALVGQIGWKAGGLLKLVEEAKSTGIRIVQTGYVPDQDLPALYGAASAFVFPSIYEGFGIPVLEALKCGAHVLASDVPEVRQAGGDHASYFEPTVPGIKQALEQFLLSDAHLHPERNLDPERLARIVSHGSTWKDEGKKLAAVITSLL